MTKNKRIIAVITITMNDNYKLKEWVHWYNEYKAEVDRFIIVDNNSTQDYRNQLYSSFPDAQIVELSYNGGCTGAYNEGIKRALSDVEVTHIALVGNDIRIEKGALTACANFLDSDERLGMVEPVLLNADSDIVCDFGCGISKYLTMQPEGVGKSVTELKESVRYCDCVTGGMNVSKREFYEKVGLQDDNLFMYSDEVDMGLRAAKCGFKLAVLSEAKSWHQHINPTKTGRRFPFSQYLIGRNKVYLAHKHFGVWRSFAVALYFASSCVKNYAKAIVRKDSSLITDANWQLIGIFKGLIGDMRPNKYSSM